MNLFKSADRDANMRIIEGKLFTAIEVIVLKAESRWGHCL